MKKFVLSMLLIVSLLLCACHAESDISLDGSSSALQTENSEQVASVGVTVDSEQSEPTESELFELHAQRVLAMLDECRPEEAYQFPDFSGEITDVRITVRERNVDMSLWSRPANDKAYDIFYGYCVDGVWYDFPSTNYRLKALESFYSDNWEAATVPHIVEIGDYLLFAFVEANEDKTMSLYDSLGSTSITVSDYFKSESDEVKNLHYKENMHAYGTAAFDLEMTEFGKWYFIILKKDSLTEDYTLAFDADWLADFPEIKTTYTYEDIMFALNRK